MIVAAAALPESVTVIVTELSGDEAMAHQTSVSCHMLTPLSSDIDDLLAKVSPAAVTLLTVRTGPAPLLSLFDTSTKITSLELVVVRVMVAEVSPRVQGGTVLPTAGPKQPLTTRSRAMPPLVVWLFVRVIGTEVAALTGRTIG